MGYNLTRICSEFTYGDYYIHLFGVDENNNAVHKKTKMRDFFYFDSEKMDYLSNYDKIVFPNTNIYKSIYGQKTVKVEYTSLKEKTKIEEVFSDYVYESDVKPEFKYLMKNNMNWADSDQRNILFFDIETWCEDGSFSDANNPYGFITAIQAYSTRDRKFYIFSWHPKSTEEIVKPTRVEKGDKVFIFCKDEEDTILSFFRFIKKTNVDILSGWWSGGFDLPYIVNRCKVINVDYEQMSPIGKVKCYDKMGDWKVYISGVDHIDYMDAVKDLGYNLPNYKLDTAAREIIDEDYGKLTEKTWKDWKNDYKGFLKYCIRDVEILKKLEENLDVFGHYCMVQKMTNITELSQVNHKTMIVDSYILTECNGKVVLPTRQTKKKVEYMGAKVLNPEYGIHDNVGVLDYASLYPTVIMSFNLSPETYICSYDDIKNKNYDFNHVLDRLRNKGYKCVDTKYSDELFGKRYLFYAQETKIGLLPKILKRMYLERKHIKSQMKQIKDKIKDDHDEKIKYNALNRHQNALKIILNSAYGAFGFNYFRLYKPEVADAITYFARRALDYAIEQLEFQGFSVIYGDTDSTFFKQDSYFGDKFEPKFVDEFNRNLKDKFIPQYNNGSISEYEMLELEYEKDLEKIYFGAKMDKDTKQYVGTKKRYYGIERESGDKYIKGLNIIRKDAPGFLKDKMNELTEITVRGNLTVDLLKELRRDIEKEDYKNIGIPKKFGKRFDSYLKNKPQHLKAVQYANENLGTSMNHLDIPYLFYIISKCEDDLPKGQRSKAICLLEEDLKLIDTRKDIFEIDYDVFFQKQVLDQLKEFEHIEYVNDILKSYKGEMKNGKR